MKRKLVIKFKDFILLIYIFYLFSIVVFGDRVEYYQYSNIIFAALAGTMILYTLGKPLQVRNAVFLFVPFLLFSFVSLIWSYVPNATMLRSTTLLRMVLLYIIMTHYLCISKDTIRFIYGIAISGLLILFYVISFYGISGLRQMIDEGARVGEEIVNSNTLAVFLAFSSIVFFHLFLKHRKWYELTVAVLLVLIIAITGSKKGILDILVGFFLVIIFGNDKADKNRHLRRFTLIIGVLLGLYILWQTPIFAVLRERVEMMFGFFRGNSARIDYSTFERRILIEAGLRQFTVTPVLGVGIDASSYVSRQVSGYSTYLHNDYVELLATGGILGFLLFYIPILKLLKGNIKNSKVSESSRLCVILLTIFMINGIAAVQYFTKLSYIILSVSTSSIINYKESLSFTQGGNYENNESD